MVRDVRMLLRLATGRQAQPSAAILDRRPRQSSPASGPRAGYEGATRQRGSTVHRAVDTLGHLVGLAWAARARTGPRPGRAVTAPGQAVTGAAVAIACVDQGYPGEHPAPDAAAQGSQREVVNLPEARQGSVLRRRRGVVERRVGWAARGRCLARDDERVPDTLAGLHLLACTILVLKRFVALIL